MAERKCDDWGIVAPAVRFRCNVCGSLCAPERFATEPPSCACGSNVRIRALIHLLSIELFGRSIALIDFPRLKSIRGLGMSDEPGYARILEDKFEYTNTYYHREPRLDVTEANTESYGSYDFILCADVLEHIAPPIGGALSEMFRLLKPRGFLGLTIFCNPQDRMKEHFPELNEYRVVPLGDAAVLINRRRDGSLEIRDDLVFHGGQGAILEMREFGITALRSELSQAGFKDFEFLAEDVPENGIVFDHDVSQPLIARKEPFSLPRSAVSQLVGDWMQMRDQWKGDDERIRAAAQSKWVRLGRRLGLGPKL